MIALANANKFNSLERPKQMTLLLEPFTIEDGILTPTMKLKRNIAKERFSKQILDMYNSPLLDLKKAPKSSKVESQESKKH